MFSFTAGAKEIKTKTTDIKNVIMSAFFSSNGVSESVLEGDIAENIRIQINRPGTEVIARAKVITTLDNNKSREKIQLNFITPEALFPTTADKNPVKKPLDIGMQFDVCEDGTLLGLKELDSETESDIDSETDPKN